jgi:hypothetical protein
MYMAVRFRVRTLDSVTKEVGESASKTLEVPRDAYIQDIYLAVNLAVLNGTTAQTMTKRQLFSIFTKIELIENGTTGRVSIDGARFYDMMYEMLGAEPLVWVNNIAVGSGNTTFSVTDSTTSTIYFEVPLLFRTNARNEFDVSGVIPAFAFSSLDLSYSTGAGWRPANANLTITEATSSAHIKVREAVGRKEDIEALNKANGLDKFFDVYYQTQVFTITTSAGYANSIDLETSKIWQQISLSQWDNSGADWVNDIVDKVMFKLVTPVGEVELNNETFESMQGGDVVRYKINVPPKGFAIYDPENDVFGLDVRGAKKGDLKLYYTSGSTIQSGSDQLQVTYKGLLPR